MTDWHECPNAQECTEGNCFGKGCVVDPAQSAMGGKTWHECHCGVDSDGNPPNLRQADEITRLLGEVERLRAAHKAIMELEGEINTGNYDHDDVVKLNNAFCEAFHISSAALPDTQPIQERTA
jgi:hypothetical protein